MRSYTDDVIVQVVRALPNSTNNCMMMHSQYKEENKLPKL